MNAWLALVWLLASPPPSRVVEIPGYFQNPRAYWQDLNGDGYLDIWVRDEQERLWVWDGKSEAAQFTAIPFDPVDLLPYPVQTDGAWRAQAYDRGVLFEFDPESGWSAVFDFNGFARVRPGMQPLKLSDLLLLPTFDGYRLLDGTCVAAELEALPSVSLDAKRLMLTYPVPFPKLDQSTGRTELQSAPIPFSQQGELGVWTAQEAADGWLAQWAMLQFPESLKMERYGTGDLDGDGMDELVVLARPAKDISLFDELSFLVYLGTGPGQWNPLPHQELKSDQNLWQEGPVEVSRKGILLYYFKGLIRTNFKMDLYRWNDGGYIEPKPVSEKWKVRHGDRRAILLDFDVNGDRATDLVLAGDEGIEVYYRRHSSPMLPFIEEPDRIFPTAETELAKGAKADEWRLSRRLNEASESRGFVFVQDPRVGKALLWHFFEGDNGFWYLRQME